MKQNKICYEDQNDAQLVACVLAGDREAFDVLLQRYSASVLHLCSTLLSDTIEAQDIAQEAALQAFLGLSRLRDSARFAAWFHAIAANLARMRLRRHHELSLHTLNDDDIVQNFWIDAPPTPEEYQAEREIQETILRALHDLSEVNRQAVIGFYLQGYSYEELAQLLEVPISTVKGRLFQGRRQLKMVLRPLADTLLQPIIIKRRQRKEQHMITPDLVELHFDSLRRLILTRQHLVLLCDPQSKRGIPIQLTQPEAIALEVAFRIQQYGDELPFPQDTSQRLLDSLGAKFQHVVINALAGQTLYATVTIVQSSQTREVDMRLSESLPLAARMNVPIFITRSLLESAATLDLTTPINLPPQEELEARGKDILKQGRQERLQWEEAVQSTLAAAYRRNRWKDGFTERLWAMLLINLMGTQENISAAELRALDIVTTFPTRDVTWDEQPMVAIRLPDQRETAWILLPPPVWEKIMRQLQNLQGLRKPKQGKEVAPGVAPSFPPIPDILPPEIQQQAEEKLAQLIEIPQVRTAFLLNPKGIVSASKGPQTQEALQLYSDSRDDLSGQPSLQNEGELRRQFGHQPQDIARIPYMRKKDIKQEKREEISANRIDAGRIMALHPSGWRLVAFTDQDMQEGIQQSIQQIWRELQNILTQSTLE